MLTKRHNTERIEGSPEIPYRAAYTHCGQTPAPGYWQTTCEGVTLPVGYQCSNGGVTSPTHDHSGEPLIYQFFPTGPCRSEWIQTGQPGPVICTSYPEQPHVPAVPERTEYIPDYGWNAGANSITTQAGDFLIRDTMGLVAGVVWGVALSAVGTPNPARITHGFMFTQTAGATPLFSIVEGGKTVISAMPYESGDQFSIRRQGTQVTYLHGDQVVYRSLRPSVGEAMVACSIYGSGDAIP